MSDDDDVEIIHSSQSLQIMQEQQQQSEFVQNLQIQNQKLILSNKSLETEAKQYKQLLDQTIENLRQSERDQEILKLQISQKDFQIQAFQINQDDRQKGTKIGSQQKLKDSNSNRESFGNKVTNISSIGGFLSSTQSPRYPCPIDGFLTRGQILSETVKKISTLLRQGEQTPYFQEVVRSLQEFEENLKLFMAIHEQFVTEIHRPKIEQQEKEQKPESSPSLSERFHSIQENTSDNQLFDDDLDTSQFENEIHIKHHFESFEIALNKLNEEEKQQWKQKLLQLINTL